jgi:hypothetical protein
MQESNLKLNEEQENLLVDYAFRRLDSLKADNDPRIKADKESWGRYGGDYDFRKAPDTIFDKSNFAVPMTPLIVDYFVTRAEDELLGTAPYFSFDAQGPSDAKTAEDYDRFFRFKVETQGRTRSRLELANLHAFVQRAAILKSIYRETKVSWRETGGVVLWDKELDQPVKTKFGPVIKGVTELETVADQLTGEERTLVKDDPIFDVNYEGYEWRKVSELEFTELVERGPRSVLVDYDAFLCPSTAASIDEADMVAEFYDKPASWVQSMWLNRSWAKWADYKLEYEQGDASAKTQVERLKDAEKLSFDDADPLIPIVECWIRRDVLGTGEPQDFVVYLDVTRRKAVWYEYAVKVSPDMKRPYTAIAVGKHSNRWWGPSLPERIRECQDYIDKQFNSASFRNELASNPISVVNPNALEEEPDEIVVTPGMTYIGKPGKTAADFITFAAIPNLDARTKELMEFVIYTLQLWLGVSNLAQGDYSNTPLNSTATGVEASLREASKMGRRYMRRIIEGFQDHLLKLVKITMATMDEEEVYEYMEGEVRSFAKMSPDEIRRLDVNVTLVLTQNQSQRQIEVADAALKVQERYLATPGPMRAMVRPLLTQILSALGFENVDELLPPPEVMDQMLGQGPAPMPQGGEIPAEAAAQTPVA